ncbi:ABC transporter ATP-binding protein [Clostridium aestuarii]|uniref:ABC transporter ATP-binding protein n=1 Tax=Clostridium aestuarii TaxID=338193 RepID=A0ABT4D389_9CLOT|nr:ABC transporter ATP-binding protein [Clostridium aestuarii]MCY6484745.1 ABC transporter ATP-binding protein [Clostridium aestuarii]
MIEMDNLTVCYKSKNKKNKALENISLNIDKGEICTVIGPSGAGKTTILKVLAGIIKKYEGKAYIDGVKANPRFNRIGLIPQNYGLVTWKTVEKNILLSSRIKDGKKNIDMKLYKELLKRLNIEKHIKAYPSELSGGERQRVSIARAFLLKPNLLLMDEPFSALDVLTREDAQRLFLDIWNEHKVTTILVTHDVKEAIYLGQKIVVMSSYPGKIKKIIKNDLFGKKYLDFNDQFETLNLEIRKILKGEKKIETR